MEADVYCSGSADVKFHYIQAAILLFCYFILFVLTILKNVFLYVLKLYFYFTKEFTIITFKVFINKKLIYWLNTYSETIRLISI